MAEYVEQYGVIEVVRVECWGEVDEAAHTGHEGVVVDGKIHINTTDYDEDEAN